MLLNEEKTQEHLNFKYKSKWLNYQLEFTNKLEACMTMPKINLIAPIGSNRFDIILELIGKIGENALIITNTQSSRSIWRSRVYTHFLDSQYRDCVSTNIRIPRPVTIITYQGLVNTFYGQASEYDPGKSGFNSLSKYRFDKANEMVNILKTAGVRTICFDEPSLDNINAIEIMKFLINNLSPLHQITVSENLPPCTSEKEKEEYEQMFGPVNEIIRLSELYKNNQLSAFQDYAYFSELSEDELSKISHYNKNIAILLAKITQNPTLLNYLYSSSYIKHSEDNAEEIYANYLFFLSLISLFKSKRYVIPESLMDLLDAEDNDFPEFRAIEAQYFVNGLIKNIEKFPEVEQEINDIKNTLMQYNLMKGNSIQLETSSQIEEIIERSTGKINAAAEIANAELNALEKDLRLVVLTEEATDIQNYKSTTNTLSVLEEFNNKNYRFQTILISDSLILIPSDYEQTFYDILKSKYISKENITISTFDLIQNYISIQPKDSLRNSVIRVLLKMLDMGIVNTIIASENAFSEENNLSKVNTLIISSTSNKKYIKIRNQILNYSSESPDRVVNIWHLCSAFEQNTDRIFISALNQKRVKPKFKMTKMHDFKNLEARFEYISGTDINSSKITNSISRILPPNFSVQSPNDLMKVNAYSLKHSKDRKKTNTIWKNLSANSKQISNSELIKCLETSQEIPTLMYQTGYYYLLTFVTIFFLLAVYLKPQLFLFSLLCAAGLLLAPTIGVCIRSTNTTMTKTICMVILKTLYKIGKIKTPPKKINIQMKNNFGGTRLIYTNSLNGEENSIFIKALYDFFETISNPIYLIVRKNNYFGLYEQKDYHSLPHIFDNDKKSVIKFKKIWKKHLGRCNVYYTGHENRAVLMLKAKKKCLTEQETTLTKITNRWF